jgi:hypothetical protein
MLKHLWRGALIATLLILIGTTFPIAQAAPATSIGASLGLAPQAK